MLPTLTFLKERTWVNVTGQRIEIGYRNDVFRLVHPANVNPRQYHTPIPLPRAIKHSPLPAQSDGHVRIENLMMQIFNPDPVLGWVDGKQINGHMVFTGPNEKAEFIPDVASSGLHCQELGWICYS